MAEYIAEQKYDLAYGEEKLKYYKDSKGNLLILMLKKVNEKYELRVHCLCFR